MLDPACGLPLAELEVLLEEEFGGGVGVGVDGAVADGAQNGLGSAQELAWDARTFEYGEALVRRVMALGGRVRRADDGSAAVSGLGRWRDWVAAAEGKARRDPAALAGIRERAALSEPEEERLREELASEEGRAALAVALRGRPGVG